MSESFNPFAAGCEQKIGFPLRGRTDNRSTSGATNAAATVALAADTLRGYAIGQVVWSYSGSPTGGRLTIASGSDTLVDLDVAASGPQEITFDPPLLTGKSEAVTITLAAGNATGKLHARVWRLG